MDTDAPGCSRGPRPVVRVEPIAVDTVLADGAARNVQVNSRICLDINPYTVFAIVVYAAVADDKIQTVFYSVLGVQVEAVTRVVGASLSSKITWFRSPSSVRTK